MPAVHEKASRPGTRPDTAARPWKRLVSAVLPCVVAACSPGPELYDVPDRLARALESPALAARLTPAATLRPCPDHVPSTGTIPQARCAAASAPPDRLTRLAAFAGRMRGEAASLHVLALVDLVADDPRGRALDRAIANLRRAAEMADRPAPVLADLAAALVVRAERAQAPRDLLEAYETAEAALRLEPRNPAALYNRALALDRLGLVDEVERDWGAYLAVDSTSPWADEARRRRDVARSLQRAHPAPPDAAAPLAAYARYAAADPQGARELGMDRLLDAWGAAVQAGDTAAAVDRLRRAAALGDALERRPGGDASLADAVRSIRATSRRGDAGLARLHRAYAAGRRAFDTLDFAGAEPHFAAVASSPDASPALRAWARVYLGATWLQVGRAAEGERLLAQAAASADPRHPALAARAEWPLGRTLARAERWETALEHARRAARLFARAGERENEGAALGILADVRFVLGEPDSGYAALHRAADRLKPYRASVRLHNLLAATAKVAADDGFVGSAIRLLGEDVGVAARIEKDEPAAEARLERARYRAAGGDPAGAAADLDTARGLVRALKDARARDWFQAHLREAEALVSLRADPERGTRALDSAAAYFAGIPFRALPAVVAGAEARLGAGDAAGALQRLETVVRMLEQRRDSIRMEPRRAAVYDAARGVMDRIVLLTLAEGRAEAALRHLDRGRASLATAGGARAGGGTRIAAPPGETALVYARIADTLLVWTVTERRVEFARTVVDTLHLARTLRELEAGMERGASTAALRPALARLHAWLIRPARGLPREGSRPLVVIADGEIAAVPFAALYDTARGRHLVEDHPVRFAVSLVEARRTPAAAPADGVLLIADPAFDRAAYPLLERLANAGREVGALRSAYPGATVLEGARATRPAVESALARSGIVHFAGHAVFDDQRPERSHLVLAPAAGGEGRIAAADLARMDLRHVRLVVLSACRTVRAGRGRAGGFTGLSGALLAAGAGGTVGSTWDVDDRLTAVLMARFHAAYRAHGDGPRALREAQLALLRSADPALRAPSAWAGFRYAGR